MTLSRNSLQVVEAFTAQLGLPARPAPDGSFSLVFANAGVLSITGSRDGRSVFLSVARRPNRLDGKLLHQASAMAGLQPATNRLLHVGLDADESLHFTIRLDDAEFDLPALDAGLQYLKDAHDRLG